MTPPTLLLLPGPFLRPGPGPARGNLWLLGLWLPPLWLALGLKLAPFAPGWPGRPWAEPPWAWPAALAGAFAGALLFAPAGRRRRALADLDWLTALALGPLAFLPLLPGLAWPALAFALGLLGGLAAVLPGLAPLRAAPGLIPLALHPLAALAVETGVRLWPDGAIWPLELNWGRPSWPFVFAAAAAGLAWHIRPRRRRRLLWPWLAVALPALAGNLAPRWLPYLDLARLAALTLPAFFIFPGLARNRKELAALEITALIFLWLPLPSTGLFALDRSLPAPAALLFGAAALFFMRRRPPAAPLADSPAATHLRPRLRCGGPSPPAAEWRGPSSCRLAAGEDGGPRLCRAGCLALGDCLAACPEGAITRGPSGLPALKPELCRGCGRCRAACPQGLWELLEPEKTAHIPCASRAGLKAAAALCPSACLGCGRCRKACGAIARPEGGPGAFRASQALCLDRRRREDCGQACAAACPRRLISF